MTTAAASMSENKLAIGQIVKDTWAVFKKEWMKIYGLMLLPIAFAIVYGIITGILGAEGLIGVILELLYFFIQTVISMGVLKAMLNIVRGEKFDIDTILSTQPLFLKYLGATLLVGLIVGIGLLLFIIPGIYMAITYTFVPYLIVDKKMGVFEAMKESSELTKGKKFDIFIFGIVAMLIGYSGILALFVGILLTAPFAGMMYPILYSRMINSPVKTE